jgi:AraC family transcriptional activator of pobA
MPRHAERISSRNAPHGAAGPLYRIPAFGLYGSAEEARAAGYAHIETIASRAPANDWRIAAHRHATLAQCIVITGGGGLLDLEGVTARFDAPWFIWLPPAVVHGFRFDPGTTGHVLTVSEDVVAAALRASVDAERIAAMIAVPRFGPLPPAEEIGVDVAGIMESIAREHELPRYGVNTVVSASLLLLLVAFLRVRTLGELADTLGRARASEFRRFRALVERDFRRQASIRAIAAELGITADTLHAVTRRAVGKGPLAVLHDRIMLECRRELIYTDKPVAEIGFDCGFGDPAHFSRFFARRAGCSPRRFRQLNREKRADPPA